ncbi:GD16727 [Drosophila simulans]|uniref:GD16727 n=1 Tax=Drosophila simulans TaxID=7240 RepID=B4R4T3_DROSI|nr:GD16727 [Drosophila simulans]
MSPAFCMDNDCNQSALYQKCHATPPPPPVPPVPPMVVSTSSTPSATPSMTPSPTPSRSPSLTLMMTSPQALQSLQPQVPQTQMSQPLNTAAALMTRTGSVGGATSAPRRNSLWLETLRSTRKLSYAYERPILTSA